MASAQLKNSFTSLGEVDSSVLPASLSLKIALNINAVRYFIVSTTHNRVLFYGQYTLHHVADNTGLAQRLQRIFYKDELLQLPFGETTIGIDTPYKLLPSELLFMKGAQQQAQYSRSTSVNVVYQVPEELQTTIKELFPIGKFSHLNSALLEQLSVNSTNKLFVNVAADYFDVVRFNENGSLLMMNRYQYKTESDFIYFVLLCCEELKLDRNTVQLMLLGEVNKQSKIYDICYRYFKNIEFAEAPEGITFSKEFADYAPHLHFNLYTLQA